MSVRQIEGLPAYKHIERNEFSYRKHKKLKEEDIIVCVCRYDTNDPDSACGERCLNVITSTECTPDYCPCGDHCRNQRFQKCEYARSRLFRTEGRGWGLLADENIKAGQFVIEYCGEVISPKEAKERSQAYEAEGLKDAYIITLNAQESIDATKKGSLARFINHSCQPNCETRKWNVLGEVRVGIFAKQDIPSGTELSYDYNFEWYGGAKVRCLCGAATCCGFLGAKSRGFQESTFLWENNDERFSVEDIPIYDSDDDEPGLQPLQAILPAQGGTPETESDADVTLMLSEANIVDVEPLDSVPMIMHEGSLVEANGFYQPGSQQKLTKKSAQASRIRGNGAGRRFSPQNHFGKHKNQTRKEVNVKFIAARLAANEASELLAYEEAKNVATAQLDSVYDEIRPAIEEFERDSQDSVPTELAETWIKASCSKLKAEFDLFASIIKNVACAPRRPADDVMFSSGMENGGIRYLENGQ